MVEDDAGFARAMSDVYPRASEWALRWKVPGLIVFGFHKPGATEENAASMGSNPVPEQVIDWLAAAGEKAARDGLQLMIEPEPICWADTVTVTSEMIGRSGCENLRINYDPGNVAWFLGIDPIDELETAVPWIANVHVKDWLPPARFVPAGEGTINYRAHFAALRRSGYAGPISLEPHMDGCLETIRRCKEALEQSYAIDTTRGD
jgi:sugar phosphate isomerase/epimerase